MAFQSSTSRKNISSSMSSSFRRMCGFTFQSRICCFERKIGFFSCLFFTFIFFCGRRDSLGVSERLESSGR